MIRGDRVTIECEVIHPSERIGRTYREDPDRQANAVGLRLPDGQMLWVRPQDIKEAAVPNPEPEQHPKPTPQGKAISAPPEKAALLGPPSKAAVSDKRQKPGRGD